MLTLVSHAMKEEVNDSSIYEGVEAKPTVDNVVCAQGSNMNDTPLQDMLDDMISEEDVIWAFD